MVNKVEHYEGPVCYVGNDQEAPDGTLLEGGWHYTTDGDQPGVKLYLEDDGGYRLAASADKSWHARHHEQLVVIAPGGNIGEPKTRGEVEAAHRHLDALERRMTKEGLDAHEKGHTLTTPREVAMTRRWLDHLEVTG